MMAINHIKSNIEVRNAEPSGFDSGFANFSVLCDSDSVSECEACATYRIYTILCDLCPSFADRPRSDY